ncbi:DUF222 domain-containing protein [Sanguibacter sp. Z1732]|uniref:HNH endonuclease signature motif containing protein n=1 Tax=Sanguibacter sp. Z1732 TaxID=3435412 RepID=UPI003D9C80F6
MAPGFDAPDEVVAAFNDPPAHVLQAWAQDPHFPAAESEFDEQAPDLDEDELVDANLIAAGVFTQVCADPDPTGVFPLPAWGERLPVGVAPRTDGHLADVGAHARRRGDWQAVYDLERLDASGMDAYTLIEAVAAWRRVEALAAYHQRILAHELSLRPVLALGKGRAEAPSRVSVAAAQLGARVGLTRQGATKLVAVGAAMRAGTGIGVGQALREGDIDADKADLLVQATKYLPEEVAMQVHDQVLPGAGLNTLPRVERDVATAVAEVDPEDLSARHARARAERRVGAPRVRPDGMATTSIYWPATDAMALHTALEAGARTAKNDGDERTLDQLRADALTTMAHTALATGRIGPCPSATTPGHAQTGDDSASAGDGCTCPSVFSTSEEAPPARGRGRHDGSPLNPGEVLTPFTLGTVGGARAQIRITVPLSTLMGTSNDAGDLEGYGPVPAEVARAFAAGGTWKRLVTDPLTNRALDVTAKRYEPPPWLREQVITNQPFCVAPGCNVQARHADLDHGVPFPHGPTAEWNLHPLCRQHHRLKTHAGFTHNSPTPGVHEWTTPTGHRYRTDHDGTHLLPPPGKHETNGAGRANGDGQSTRNGPVRTPSSSESVGPPHAYPSRDDPPPF